MDDFEYSVEICDRDWECFFAECEECNLLPPSLAGVDDSGMSDFDETGSIQLKKDQKFNLTAGFSEADHSMDAQPDCEGSPVEDYLSKYSVSGMESLLSGSEEDIHLQSVNMFFERLKNVAEAEKLAEPNQVGAGKITEEIKLEQQHSDGQQSSSICKPKSVTKLNFLPPGDDTAFCKEPTKSVDTVSSINTKKKSKPTANVSPESVSSNSVLKSNKSTYPETYPTLFISEEACREVNVVTQQNLSHDSVVCSETLPHKVVKGETCSPLKDVKREHLLTSYSPVSGKNSTNSPNNQEIKNVKWKEEQISISQSDATSISKSASQELSPSASVKRKRRKRRRLSFEPSESAHGYERQVLAQQSDSGEEQYSQKGGPSLCLYENVKSFPLNEAHKNILSSLCSGTSNLPQGISGKEMKANYLSHTVPPCQHLPENIIRQGICKPTSSAENNGTGERSITPLSQIDDGIMSAADDGDNVIKNLQPWTRLESVASTRLNQSPWSPVSVSVTLNGQSSRESNDCVDMSQNDKISAAKSVLEVKDGNSGTDNHTLCQKEAEAQQQLEIDCQDTDQYSSGVEKTDGLNTKPQEFKSKAYSLLETCAKFTSDCMSSSLDERCLSKSPPSVDPNNMEQRKEDNLEIHTVSKLDILSVEKTELTASELMDSGSPCSKMNPSDSNQGEMKLSVSKDSITYHPDIASLSSCCTRDTEPVRSLSNEIITDLSGNQMSVNQGEKITQILAKHEAGDVKSGTKSHSVSNNLIESKHDLLGGKEYAMTASQAECVHEKAPESNYSVFAISSFWSEMEKLTINDILQLRTSKAAPPSSLPPLPESEESNMFAATDSGFSTQLDESMPVQTNEDMPSVPDCVESNLPCVEVLDSSARTIMWESEPAPVSHGTDIYTENMTLTPVSHISHPFIPGRSEMSQRKISKNVSMQNLHALESKSLGPTWKGQTLLTLGEGESEKFGYFPEENTPMQEKDMESLSSSLKDSYKISVMDIFHYFFGGKQSIPSESPTDNKTTLNTDGNSVPETYDHFFSDFDTENVFSLFLTTEDKAKDELVPIFSYSHSANRNFQFPEAYDYFFESSSPDDSSVESEGEDDCSPVRVATRFSRKASSSQISTDIYENFFTDSDLRQDFFWKTTLSFRNRNFAGSTVQKQTLSRSLSDVNVSQSGRSLRRAVYPSNALGNQDMLFPDPLLYNLEDRILKQQAQHPFRYEDLQTAVSNPRLDASFLRLRQSDMCLVCIAFSSWVLKTANPQVGDAWKAVLLANVSALSAIRYLRKYVKIEAATSEKKPHDTTPSES